jgi:hypothetical protein
MKRALIAAASVALLSWAAPAAAQVKLEFRNGRVNLTAQNAQIRTILAEWARVGGTRIVNGEKIAGPPVTLELTGVSERQAMDVLLRNTAGYIIAARDAGATSPSSFGSILILATTTAPRQVASAPVGSAARTIRPPDPEPDPDPEEDPVTDTPPDADSRAATREAVEEAARRRVADRRQQIFVGEQGDPDGRTPAAQTSPANPFGLPPGSARPGVITAPPPQSPNTRRVDPEP